MKRLIILLAVALYGTNAGAQVKTDTVTPKHSDTLRIGNIIILKRGSKKSSGTDSTVTYVNSTPKKTPRIVTNWGGIDIGFSCYDDRTDYPGATASGFLVNKPGTPLIGKDDFKLRTGKSTNINIWIVMQQLNLVKENISLKYGLGLELNNYRYKSNISYKENGFVPYSNDSLTNKPFIFRDSISFSKNKLAADYLTVPVMLNFATNDWGNNRRGFNVAIGVSFGYLYSQRNKQKSDIRGKETNKGDYDLERFKFSYVGEIGFGFLKFYASYSPQSLYEHSMNMRPYNFGIRINAL